jgi:prevent-host-death family protein
MKNIVTLTEAKAKFSEIINRIIYNKKKIFITKKGEKVAAIIPMEELQSIKKGGTEGLIRAQGALEGLDEEIDLLTSVIYDEREKEQVREVRL